MLMSDALGDAFELWRDAKLGQQPPHRGLAGDALHVRHVGHLQLSLLTSHYTIIASPLLAQTRFPSFSSRRVPW